MKKKIVSALLCVAMAASLVVGCGSKSGSDSGSSKGGDKLVYWAMWSEDEPQAKVIKEAISKYEKDTGVKVDVQFKGRTGQREGLEPALSAKQQIDLFDEDVNRVNGSWGKYLLDLEDMAKDYESEHGNETLFKIARNAYGQTHDGDDTLHSIPYQPSIFGFFYNKTLFTKAGIESVPTTWEELDAACAKLKEAGITMNVEVIDNGVWTSSRSEGSLQATIVGWFPLYADADNQMYTYYYSENAVGKGVFYNNPEFDALMTEARQTVGDDAKREELYKQADYILSREDYATIPLYYPKLQFVAKPYVKNAKLGNLIYHLYNIDIDLSKK